MAIERLSPAQIQTVINEVYKEITGKEGIDTVDVENVIDVGVAELKDYRDKWTGALLNRLTKLWYTDESYRSTTAKLYFEDSQTFGSICEYINITVPEAEDNAAWKVANGDTVGTYVLHAPTVTAKFYVKSDVWQIPLDFTNEQMTTCFSSDAELQNFVSYCWLALDNAITQKLEAMANTNRNAFICQKFIKQYADGNTKCHVYNLVRAFVDFMGISTSYTVKDALANEDFYRFASREIAKLVGFMRKQTNKFNEGDTVKFVPDNRIVLELLGSWVDYANAISYSGTFNKELVELPNYNATATWQAIDTFDIEDLGRIKLDVGTVVDTRTYGNESNTIVCGFACDKYALAFSEINRRTATEYKPIENVTLNRVQFHDKYLNNLELPAIVFTMSDVIVS